VLRRSVSPSLSATSTKRSFRPTQVGNWQADGTQTVGQPIERPDESRKTMRAHVWPTQDCDQRILERLPGSLFETLGHTESARLDRPSAHLCSCSPVSSSQALFIEAGEHMTRHAKTPCSVGKTALGRYLHPGYPQSSRAYPIGHGKCAKTARNATATRRVLGNTYSGHWTRSEPPSW